MAPTTTDHPYTSNSMSPYLLEEMESTWYGRHKIKAASSSLEQLLLQQQQNGTQPCNNSLLSRLQKEMNGLWTLLCQTLHLAQPTKPTLLQSPWCDVSALRASPLFPWETASPNGFWRAQNLLPGSTNK